MSTCVIFDGNAILHRAYHALPGLTTKDGKPINAVYGMVSILLKVIVAFDPQYIVFAFDTKEPTFRNALLPDYQAHRKEVDDKLISQFEKARDTLNALGIPYLEAPGYEADDVIGTLAGKLYSEARVSKVLIVTGDKDIIQLVNDKVNLFMPKKGVSEGEIIDRASAYEKMGVTPEQIVDYKALVGDPSDNYKGIPGIGPKTALNLLDKYKSFEGIYKSLDKLPEKTRTILIKNKESGELSKTLAQIKTDLPLKLLLDQMSDFKIDGEKVMALFEKYGFRTLTNRVKEVGKELAKKKQIPLL